jgi:ketosteroid isomerase-like protein
MAMKHYVLIALLFAGCASVNHSGDVEVLMKADRDFAHDSDTRGAAAWEAAFAPNASKPNPDGSWTTGAKAIGEQMGKMFATGGKLQWAPINAQISKGGNLGSTWGRYTFTAPDGKQRTGMYVTVWEKQKDGSWKALFDDGDRD